MTTLQTLCENVYEITARPDLVTLTKMCVRDAIRAAHSLQDFDRDVEVVALTDYAAPPSTEGLTKQFVDCAMLPLTRQTVAIVADFGDNSPPFDGFEKTQRELVLYDYSPEPYTYEIRGASYHIGFTRVPVSLHAKVRRFPIITFASTVPPVAEECTSWFLAESEISYIQYYAAAAVLRGIGMLDDARGLEALSQQAALQLVTNYS